MRRGYERSNKHPASAILKPPTGAIIHRPKPTQYGRPPRTPRSK